MPGRTNQAPARGHQVADRAAQVGTQRTHRPQLPPSLKMRQTHTQTVATTTRYSPVWLGVTPLWDTGGFFDPVRSRTKLLVRKAGEYAGYATARFASNAVGYRVVDIYVNSASQIDAVSYMAVSTTITQVSLPFSWIFNAGDMFEVRVEQGSGGDLELEQLYLYVHLVGPGSR